MSPLPHNPSFEVTASEAGRSSPGAPSGQEASTQEFSSPERAQLLHLAHDSISSALENSEIVQHIPTPHLAEHRGVFTSLYLRGELRGCVGYVLPKCRLDQAVVETARAAAFEDGRFPPVTRDEAPHLKIELSILSAPAPIQPDALEVGRHGLLISWQGRRGLLLPQVSIEHGWDRTTFLEQTCRKAGLPLDAWQKGATIEGFTAEVFGEKSGQ